MSNPLQNCCKICCNHKKVATTTKLCSNVAEQYAEVIWHPTNEMFLKKVKFFCEREGNIRKCWLPAFSLYLTMFAKAFFLWIVKILDLW